MNYYEIMNTIVNVGFVISSMILVFGLGYLFGYTDGKEK